MQIELRNKKVPMKKIMHQSMFQVVMLLVLPWKLLTTMGEVDATTMAESSSITKPGCPDKCGNVSVPYPFGIGDINCAMTEEFLLTCNHTSTPATLIFGDNVPVSNISVDEGTVVMSLYVAYQCFNKSGSTTWFDVDFRLGDGPYRFSDTRNKLIAIGCDTVALMNDRQGNFGSGCISLCNQDFTKVDSCSGFGCSQTSVPKNLKTLNISIESRTSHKKVWRSNPCGYAFLADERTFNVSGFQLSTMPEEMVTANSTMQWTVEDGSLNSNSVIEWVAEEKTCEEAMKNTTSYACRENTDCVFSENGQGYRCSCKQGFAGNPYLEGCQDIDECKAPETYPCHGPCKNTPGNYSCSCPFGMYGDGKNGCQGFRIATIASVVGGMILVVVISVLIVIIFKRQRNQKNFLRNGGMLLKHQRVRIFTEAELAKATKDYDKGQFLGEGGFGSVYKGVLASNIEIAVKKPKQLDKAHMNREFQHEIGIVSQVNHKNVVKLLGLCLETKVPLLVYEFISNGTLYQHIHCKRSQILTTWKNCLRIATEIALALDYLHSLADPPIIHGDIKSTNILLDNLFTAKVSDFGASVLISPGETDIATKIKGTLGYLDPEYLMTGILTAKSDVYSFGVLLLEILTGEKPNSNKRSGEKTNIIQYFLSSLENNNLSQVICLPVTDKDEMEEIEIFAELAKQCLKSTGLKRPTMKEVSEELTRLEKLHQSSWLHHNSKETEHLLGESSSFMSADSATAPPVVVTIFGIEYSGDSV